MAGMSEGKEEVGEEGQQVDIVLFFGWRDDILR
jgi:hypothetical protein